MMTQHAGNLEKRRQRLDRLREELEGRHQELLETQIAVDEAWAQLAQVTGDDGAQERVDRAREQLAEYVRSLREGLNEQRRELDEARQQFEEQRECFRNDRQQLTESMAERESQLRRQEERLTGNWLKLLNGKPPGSRLARPGSASVSKPNGLSVNCSTKSPQSSTTNRQTTTANCHRFRACWLCRDFSTTPHRRDKAVAHSR